jgi:hypothetical protein
MKATQTHCGTTIFGGLLAAIADGWNQEPKASGSSLALASAGARPAKGPERPGLLGRIGERMWRHQLESVDLQVARSDDLFASLDRWLWKQHQRETEAWLAQASDVHDLEARIRHLERNRDGRVF